MVVTKEDRDVSADRQLLEGEIMRPRGASDGPIGIFALHLALARWIGGITERRKARKSRDG
jgi:hypothetical protein